MSYIFPRIEPICDSGALLGSHSVPEVIYAVTVPVTGSNTPAAAVQNLDAGAVQNTAVAEVRVRSVVQDLLRPLPGPHHQVLSRPDDIRTVNFKIKCRSKPRDGNCIFNDNCRFIII